MRIYSQTRHASWQRPLVAALALLWLVAGILPTAHHHESDVAVEIHHDSGLTLSQHLETPERKHHEACWLCVKTLSSSGLVKPQTASVDEQPTDLVYEASRILPPVAAGRHGASRAPPVA